MEQSRMERRTLFTWSTAE